MSGETSSRPYPAMVEELSGDFAWAVVEVAPDGILITDDAGTIVLANHRTEELFGYAPGELLGRPVEILLPDESRSVHRAHRTRYRAEPRTRAMGSGLDLRGRRRDGTVFPVEISLSPLSQDGELRVIAVIRDISDRIAAEEENRRIRATLDATHDGVFIFDPVTLRHSYVNLGAIEQTGYTEAQLLEMTPVHLNPELDERAFREVLAPLLSGEVSARTLTTVHRRSDGTDVPVEVLVQYPPVQNESSRPVVAIVRDISDRMEADRAIRQSEERMRTLYRVASELRIGSDEQFRETVHAAAVLLGVDGGFLARIEEGTPRVLQSWDACDPAPSDLPTELVALSLQTVAANDVTVRDGSSSFIGAPIEVDGNPFGVIAFYRATPREEPWSVADRDFVRLLANWLARTIERNLTEDALLLAQQDLAVTEDRERIARDLHDTVIQRLFAAGMGLQSTISRVADPGARERLEQAVDDLDETIREIRTAIFGLQAPPDGGPGLRGDIVRITNGAREALGFSPRVQFSGAIESIPARVAEHLLPTLREALTNVAKHAQASAVRVSIEVDREVRLRVTDNGVGPGEDVAGGHGVPNLRARAEELGGTFSLGSAPTGGTLLEWCVPVERDGDGT
ncbi:PAS domain S-box protein [Rhabdothermincola sediminis]|uniref:PAS domain S-box protein n=1 Tax=Rhabdothermincola sediminis TaxID=2751370 RepID=UPI001AA0586F|nr:PAS domain S-box protein [Rhabdothermincola sediminis]